MQFEAMARNIAALKDFRRASDRASKLLIGQNFVLLVVTAALIWLTLQLS